MSASVTLTPEHKDRDERIRQAPGEHHPRLVTTRDVRAQMHGQNPMSQFNSRLAVLITKRVGTMWCAYIFPLIAIGGAVPVLTSNAFLPAVRVLGIPPLLHVGLFPVVLVRQHVVPARQDRRDAAYR